MTSTRGFSNAYSPNFSYCDDSFDHNDDGHFASNSEGSNGIHGSQGLGEGMDLDSLHVRNPDVALVRTTHGVSTTLEWCRLRHGRHSDCLWCRRVVFEKGNHQHGP